MNTSPTPRPHRRAFLATTAAAAGLALLAPSPALAVTPALKFSNIPGTGDVKVLNYALALEDLEANLYSQALLRLTTGGTNALGKTIPGLGLSQNAPDVNLVREFGDVEREHRNLLRTTLGNSAIDRFRYDFGIETRSRKGVLDLIYLAEKTGVSAYLGAIRFFATRTYLQVAGAIQGTEARHTAVFASLLNNLFDEGLDVAPRANQGNGIDQPMTPDAVLAAVSPFIVTN